MLIQQVDSVLVCHYGQLFQLTQPTNTAIITARHKPSQNNPRYIAASITSIFERLHMACQFCTTALALQFKGRPMNLPRFLEYAFCTSHVVFVLLYEILQHCLIHKARSITDTVQRALSFGTEVEGGSVRVIYMFGRLELPRVAFL